MNSKNNTDDRTEYLDLRKIFKDTKFSMEERIFIGEVYEVLEKFINSDDTEFHFESYNSFKRRLVHNLAVYCGFETTSEGEGMTRHNVVKKVKDQKFPKFKVFSVPYTHNREYLTRKSKIGVEVVLNADGSVGIDKGASEDRVLDRRMVKTGSFKVINNKIVEFTDSEWR